MSRSVQITCDGCGKQKQQSNNWFRAGISHQPEAIFITGSEKAVFDERHEIKDFCGSACALKFISERLNQQQQTKEEPEPLPGRHFFEEEPPMMQKQPTTEELYKTVNAWNKQFPIGTPVNVRRDDGRITETTTRSPASVLSGHTAVIWLDGISGCYDLSRVTAREEPASV